LPTSGGRLVCIVRLGTKRYGFCFFLFVAPTSIFRSSAMLVLLIVKNIGMVYVHSESRENWLTVSKVQRVGHRKHNDLNIFICFYNKGKFHFKNPDYL
jgi:hypothetical protein